MKKIITIITLAAAVIAVPVCYKLFADKKSTQKNGLAVSAHVLATKEECGEAFGKKGKNLIRKKEWKSIYPIKVDLTNNTIEKKQLALQKTNIELASKRTVSRRIHHLDFLKVALVGGGIFAVSVALGFAGGVAVGGYAYYGLPYAACMRGMIAFEGMAIGIATGLVAAPAAIMIFEPKFRKRNKQTKDKLFGSQKFIIEPVQTQTLFLFVQEKDFKENIELTFKDGNGNEETFACPVSLS